MTGSLMNELMGLSHSFLTDKNVLQLVRLDASDQSFFVWTSTVSYLNTSKGHSYKYMDRLLSMVFDISGIINNTPFER